LGQATDPAFQLDVVVFHVPPEAPPDQVYEVWANAAAGIPSSTIAHAVTAIHVRRMLAEGSVALEAIRFFMPTFPVRCEAYGDLPVLGFTLRPMFLGYPRPTSRRIVRKGIARKFFGGGGMAFQGRETRFFIAAE
jgi:hypothetical protein